MKSKTQFKQLLLLLLVFTFSTAIVFAQNCGDINADGSTDIVDALLVAQCYVSLISCPSADIGDVNCDGSIDIVDGLLIAQLYVGLISALHCCDTPIDTPNPTPGEDVTLEMQAETDATWDDAAVESDHSGFTGTGYVNTANSEGRWIEWTVDVDRACNATCVFTYAVSGSGRPMDLTVNNSNSASLSFPDTGAWTTWSTETADIILDTGSNAIRLTATGSSGAANIDKMDITISGGTVVTPTPTPISSAVPTPDPNDTPTSSPTQGRTPDPNTEEELKAFPSAEGYGRFATGGRGGRVIEVTNLNDSGPGSLRAAIDETGPRTVVFNISGIIELQSKLLITGTKGNGHLTIAGQTAPNKGILIKGWTVGMIGGEHVIIRFIRTRVGTSSGKTMDGMGMASGDISIFDHCSISWTIDEGFSSRSGKNITLQRTLISEALNEAGHSNYPAGTQHGYAASISGDIGSFHHNLLAHCAGRNWSLAGGLEHGTLIYAGRLDIRNNVVYNWRHRTTDGGAHEVNFVNNYYKPGAATETFVALNAQNDGFEGMQRYFFSGNVMPGHFDESNQENGRIATGEPRDYDPWVNEPFFESHVTTQTAGEAYEDVLANVGANVPMLDDHDKRIIRETRDGTYTYRGSKTGYPGLVDNEADSGGYENYPVETRPGGWDTDHDGMPNAWEEAHNLDPSNPADGNATTFSNVGYTNLEMYLNELAGDPVIWKN